MQIHGQIIIIVLSCWNLKEYPVGILGYTFGGPSMLEACCAQSFVIENSWLCRRGWTAR